MIHSRYQSNPRLFKMDLLCCVHIMDREDFAIQLFRFPLMLERVVRAGPMSRKKPRITLKEWGLWPLVFSYYKELLAIKPLVTVIQNTKTPPSSTARGAFWPDNEAAAVLEHCSGSVLARKRGLRRAGGVEKGSAFPGHLPG